MGNILVIESGGSKSDWWYFDEETDEREHIRTKGYHPRWSGSNLTDKILPYITNERPKWQPEHIYYYGAGVSTDKVRTGIKKELGALYGTSQIKVYDDLIGAAQALLGQESGLIAILGTGSNSGYYDGEKIAHKVPSLGFLLGDEGSGAYLGKLIVNEMAYTRDDELRQSFEKWAKKSIDGVVKGIYRSKNPVHWLARYSEFAAIKRGHDVVDNIIKTNFDLFIEKILMAYENVGKVNFVGGIAMGYKQELLNAMEAHGLEANQIRRDCGGDLIQYHIKRQLQEQK